MKHWMLEVCSVHQLRRLSPSPTLSIYFNCEQLRAKRPGRGGGGAGLIVMED